MRLYSVTDEDEEYFLIVANNAKEAKKIGFQYLDCEFIYVRVNWIRNANVKNMNPGLYKNKYKALKNGWYSGIYDDCPVCGENDAEITYDEEKEKFCCCACGAYFNKGGK